MEKHSLADVQAVTAVHSLHHIQLCYQAKSHDLSVNTLYQQYNHC